MYKDRREAGTRLAAALSHYKGRKDLIVLGLPRGGVVVGYEIAQRLECPLDVLIIRKLGFPGQPELAIGAISETGTIVLNEEIIATYDVSEEYIKDEISRQTEEIARRKSLYRGGKALRPLNEKVVLLVDDGVATGATMKAAVSTLKGDATARLIVALPVASRPAEEEIKKMVNEWICLEVPEYFVAVGSFYQNFTQVPDEEVIELLKSGSLSDIS